MGGIASAIASSGAGSAAAGALAGGGAGNILGIAGGLFKAIQGVRAGDAEASYYNFMAGQYDQQADAIMDQAHRDAVLLQRNAERIAATQRAGLATGGMGASQSAIEVLSDTAAQAALDVEAIKYNANLKAREARNQAYLQRLAAKNAKAAGRMSGISDLIGTAGQVADFWYRYRQTGDGAGQ
jgi:hypothetical protein